jgi:hypothetical protein
MKKIIIFSILLISFSCIKTNHNTEIKNLTTNRKGIIIFFNGNIVEDSKLKISINEQIVFDKIIYYNDSHQYVDKIKIQTNIKDTTGYNFKIQFSNREKSFFLPANGLDSVLINYSCYFDVKLVDDSFPVQKKPFEIRLTKNIEKSSIVKIAADSDTLYIGEFINNFPQRYYNSMNFTPDLIVTKAYNFYVEIDKYYIYFDYFPKWNRCVNVDFYSYFNIFTNLDDDWEKFYMPKIE